MQLIFNRWRPLGLYLFCFYSISLVAQGENNIWLFGNENGVDFNGGDPLVIKGFNTKIHESACTISDQDGSLIFYTDGLSLWGANGAVTPNGEQLNGSSSTSQGALFIPSSTDSNIVNLFVLESVEQNTSGNLSLSIIDKRLNSGLGDIVSGSKNILVGTGYAEGMIAIKGHCGASWVLLRKDMSKELHTYKVVGSEVSGPFISEVIQTDIYGLPEAQWRAERRLGGFSFSSASNLAAMSSYSGVLELYKFDTSSGLLSDPISVESYSFYEMIRNFGLGYISSGFSKDGLKLIAQEQSRSRVESIFYQYDLSNYSGQSIKDSKKEIAAHTLHFINYSRFNSDPQNEKIYVSFIGEDYLASISCGGGQVDCIYRDSVLQLINPIMRGIGLQNRVIVPDPIPDYTKMIVPTDTTICTGGSIVINANVDGLDSVVWSDGVRDVDRSIDAAGTYVAYGYKDQCSGVDSIVIREMSSSVDVLRDTTLCGGAVTLSAPAGLVVWSDGSTADSMMVSDRDTIWVEYLSSSGCLLRDTSIIRLSTIDVGVGPTLQVCAAQGGYTFRLPSEYQYQWADGVTDSIYHVDTSGLYMVMITDTTSGCSVDYPIDVSIDELVESDYVRDAALCVDQVIEITPLELGTAYLWSDSSQLSTWQVGYPGEYWLEISRSGCTYRDSFIIDALRGDEDLPRDTTLCLGDTLIVEIDSPHDFEWEDGGIDAIRQISDEGLYWITEYLSADCTDTDTMDVRVVSDIDILSIVDTTICTSELPLELVASATADADILWSTGDTGAEIFIREAGTYAVEMQIAACSYQDTIRVHIDADCSCASYIPNIVSKGSAENAVLKLESTCSLAEMSWELYDRWGALLYGKEGAAIDFHELEDELSLAIGVYVYILQYRFDGSAESHRQVGTVTVVD